MILEEIVWASPRLSDDTKKLYAGRVREFVVFVGEHPSAWTIEAVEWWRDQLLAKGLNAKTVNLYMSAVRYSSKRFARRHGGIDFAQGVEAVKVIEAEPKKHALMLEECKALLATCSGRSAPDLRDTAMILIGIHAALRRKEIVNMDLAGVGDNMITVTAKGGRLHRVSVQGHPWQALKKWTSWLGHQGIDQGRVFRSLSPSALKDEWYLGESLTPDGFYKILQRRTHEAGITRINIHPHGLRHTHVWLALQAGVPLWRIQLVLGHKSQLMTAYYAEDLNPDPVGASFPSLVEGQE